MNISSSNIVFENIIFINGNASNGVQSMLNLPLYL